MEDKSYQGWSNTLSTKDIALEPSDYIINRANEEAEYANHLANYPTDEELNDMFICFNSYTPTIEEEHEVSRMFNGSEVA